MINTDALKDKVLDLALRGLLTTQIKEDGSAQELYESIQEDKKKLFALGEIEKNKIIPITDEDFPYEIPDNWKWIRWGDLSERIQYGYNAPGKQSGRIKLVRISDIQGGKVLWDTVPYCDIEESIIETYLLHENDILFARTGGTVGKSYLVEDIAEDAVFAGYLIRTSYSNKLCAKYMKYFMESKLYWKQLQSGTIATAQPNCNAKTLSKMLLPLPPLNEQIRIVNVIDEVFGIIEELEEQQEQYEIDKEALKSKLIDAGIRGKLTEQLPEDGKTIDLLIKLKSETSTFNNSRRKKSKKAIKVEKLPFDIPDNWEWCRLSDIAYTNIGLTYRPEDVSEDGTMVIRSSNIQNGKVDYNDIVRVKCPIKGNQYLNNNDIVICARNGSKALVGKCAIFEGKDKEASFGAFMAVLRTPCYKYVYYYLHTQAFRRYFSDDDTKQINQVTQNILKNAYIPLPPLDEQKRIVERIDELLQYCQ